MAAPWYSTIMNTRAQNFQSALLGIAAIAASCTSNTAAQADTSVSSSCSHIGEIVHHFLPDFHHDPHSSYHSSSGNDCIFIKNTSDKPSRNNHYRLDVYEKTLSHPHRTDRYIITQDEPDSSDTMSSGHQITWEKNTRTFGVILGCSARKPVHPCDSGSWMKKTAHSLGAGLLPYFNSLR